MKRLINLNTCTLILSISLITFLGIQVLNTNSFMEINLTEGIFRIDGRK